MRYFLFILLSFIFAKSVIAGSLIANEHEVAPLRVVDSESRVILLKSPAKRIVALAPHIVENAFSAGIGEALIARVSYSDYPEQALALPLVGNYSNINVEAVIALQPDLILAWQSGNNRASIQRFIDLGIPVYFDEPETFDNIAQVINDYAVLGGKPEYGLKKAELFLKKIDALRVAQKNKSTLSVFYQVWNSPLQTLNGSHMISKVIELCKGQNIFYDAPTSAPVVSREAILGLNPDVIVASGMGESRPEWLDEWKKYANLKAVQHQNLRHIHPDILQRQTLRIAQGAEAMCRILNESREHLSQGT